MGFGRGARARPAPEVAAARREAQPVTIVRADARRGERVRSTSAVNSLRTRAMGRGKMLRAVRALAMNPRTEIVRCGRRLVKRSANVSMPAPGIGVPLRRVPNRGADRTPSAAWCFRPGEPRPRRVSAAARDPRTRVRLRRRGPDLEKPLSSCGDLAHHPPGAGAGPALGICAGGITTTIGVGGVVGAGRWRRARGPGRGSAAPGHGWAETAQRKLYMAIPLGSSWWGRRRFEPPERLRRSTREALVLGGMICPSMARISEAIPEMCGAARLEPSCYP